MNLEYFMNEAYNEACKAYELDEVPVGAVVVYDNKIIGRGFNSVEESNHSTNHAEIKAITQAQDYLGDWRLNGCSLFTTLEPCIMCAGAIIQSRIENLYYAAKDENRGFAGSVLNILNDDIFNHKVNVVNGIMEEESRALLLKFFRKKREK